MVKKRTSLDALFMKEEPEKTVENNLVEKVKTEPKKKSVNKTVGSKDAESKIIKQTVYLPPEVYEQLRLLAFEERKKMHDYLVEGLDRVFKNRGLKPFNELTKS